VKMADKLIPIVCDPGERATADLIDGARAEAFQLIQGMKSILVLSAGIITLLFAFLPVAYAQREAPRFEPSDCPIDVPDDPPIDCGYLIVPEDYDDPEGATIRLPIIIIHSRSANPAPDPLLYTAGGPGYSSLGSVWGLAISPFVDARDVIIFEQRGNLYAEPSLDCDISMWREEGEENTPCLDGLRARGIDPAHYTTASIVADIDALRRVLGYDEWNLYGGSYSTRLMLLSMSLHPQGIRSVVLQSVSPPTETPYAHDPEHAARALQVMLDDCAADPACAEAYPNLESQLYTLVSRLNAAPVPVEFIRRDTGEPVGASVDGNTLVGWMVADAFYDPAYPPYKSAYLPLLIDQVERGNTDLLHAWRREEVSRWAESPFAWGLYFAVNCQDDAPLVTPGHMASQAATYPELDGYLRHASELAICEAWDLPAAPPLIAAPVESDIPTLVLAGAYDPITPPEWSRSVAKNLSHSYYFEFPAAGHNVGVDHPCMDGIIAAFVNDPASRPGATCLSDARRPEFVLPQGISIAPGVYRIIDEVEFGGPRGEPWLEAAAVAALLIFLAEMGFVLIAGVVRRARPRKGEAAPDPIARFAHPLAGLVAVLNTITPFVVATVNNHFLSTDPIVLRFGLSTAYPPVFHLAVLVLVGTVLTVGLVIITPLAWVRRYWSIPGRVLFSLVTLAALFSAALMAHWDLLGLLF
jgi:pimeloyl-ACP methyl ester carboxylesterase